MNNIANYEKIIEELAALEHEQWIYWSKGVANEISIDRKRRWESKFWVPYENLSDLDKDDDRKWAVKVLNIVNKYTEFSL